MTTNTNKAMIRNLHAQDVMIKEVVVSAPEDLVKDISKIMADTGYQRIPVVEEDKLIGLITQSCIIRALADYLD